MLTRLNVKNFKSLEDVEIELGNTVIFIGPNNSGKTTALQALAIDPEIAEKLDQILITANSARPC